MKDQHTIANGLADICKIGADVVCQSHPVTVLSNEREFVWDVLYAGMFQFIYEACLYEQKGDIGQMTGQYLGTALGKWSYDRNRWSRIQDTLDRERFNFLSDSFPLQVVHMRNPHMTRYQVAVEVAAIFISHSLGRLIEERRSIEGMAFEPRMMDATGFVKFVKLSLYRAYAKFCAFAF